MFISEIYRSLQGEGTLTGTASVFIRTSGCNLRCGFCDTPYASWNPTGRHLELDAVMQEVGATAEGAKHVVITGGEPMIARELPELCQMLSAAGFHLTIETAGTVFLDLDCDLMSISPKLANSDPDLVRAGEWLKKHRATRQRPEVIQRLIDHYEHQLKFVVASEADVNEVLEYLEKLKGVEVNRVLLMPEGTSAEVLAERMTWMKPTCERLGFQLCPRKHIEWYGNLRGT